MAQTARKQAPESGQRQLCRELLDLRADNRDLFGRIDEINARLKAIATDQGNFRETFQGLGYVGVSGESEAQPDGIHPEVDEQAFYALPKDAARGLSQAKLIEAGVIKEELRMKRAQYGRVTPKLF